MKKSLLIVLTLALTFSASAQRVKRVNLQKNDLKMEKVTRFNVMSDQWKPIDMRKLVAETGTPEFAIARPGGVLFGGLLQSLNNNFAAPTLIMPAYKPLTFGIAADPDLLNEDGTIKDGVTYWLGIPFFNAESSEYDYYENAAGEDVTASYAFTFNKCPSPIASCSYNGVDAEFQLVPSYTDEKGQNYEPLIITGGEALESGDYSQTLGNYLATWGGDYSLATKYFTLGGECPNKDLQYKDQNATGFKMTSVIETFDRLQGGMTVEGISFNGSLAGDTNGQGLTAYVMTYTYSEHGIPVLADTLAKARLEAPVSNQGGWAVYYSNQLQTMDGEDLEDGLVLDEGTQFCLVFKADEGVKFMPIFPTHSKYFPGEEHAWGQYTFNMDGEEYEIIDFCNYGWNSSDGSSAYQSSWTCGVVASFPFINVREKEVFEAPFNGGSKVYNLDSYYNFGDFVEYTLADGSELPSWISTTYENGSVEQDGQSLFNGEVALTLNVEENPYNTPREAVVKMSILSANDTIKIVQAANPNGTVDGINSLNSSAVGVVAPSYNVMGQRVAADTKGIVIRGGRKVINK
jgi:hypothetical protein